MSTAQPGATRLVLHEHRFFDSDAAVRRSAFELYEQTRDLPLVCPHGHVDPALLAEDGQAVTRIFSSNPCFLGETSFTALPVRASSFVERHDPGRLRSGTVLT